MHNALINKRLNMGFNSPFSSKTSDHINPNHHHKQQNIQKNEITQKLSKNTKAQKINTMMGFVDYEKHKLSNVHPSNLFFSKNPQQNDKFIYSQYEQIRPLIRNKKNSNEQLKPKEISKELKQIQNKIYSLQKYCRRTQFSTGIGNKKQYKMFLHNSKLEKMFQNRKNNDKNNLKEEINLQEQNKKNQWYIRAIQTHLKQNSQKINLNYSPLDDFTRKNVISERKVGKALHPKTSIGLKKRAVSYEIKYI